MPISLTPSQLGRGWRELELSERLTTLTQSYLPDKDVWVDASFLTKDGYRNLGRMNYRTPVSWYAYVWAAYKVLPKLWRRYIKREKF